MAFFICLEVFVPFKGSMKLTGGVSGLGWAELARSYLGAFQNFRNLFLDKPNYFLPGFRATERAVYVGTHTDTWLSVSVLGLTAPVDGIHQYYSLLPFSSQSSPLSVWVSRGQGTALHGLPLNTFLSSIFAFISRAGRFLRLWGLLQLNAILLSFLWCWVRTRFSSPSKLLTLSILPSNF